MPAKSRALRPVPSADPAATPRPTGRRERAVARSSTREQLIRCGVEVFCERGFQATGLDVLLSRVDVPKGSFYHFFASKHAFGLAVIQAYASYFERKLARCLEDGSKTPLDRLRGFGDDAARGMRKFEFRRGCLVGNLGQELGGLDDAFRQLLESVLQSWQAQLARCLQLAVDAGELPRTADAAGLAEFFWVGWEGAILRAKLTRNNDPLERFMAGFLKIAGA